jgi:hypothetical protein
VDLLFQNNISAIRTVFGSRQTLIIVFINRVESPFSVGRKVRAARIVGVRVRARRAGSGRILFRVSRKVRQHGEKK